MAYLCHLSISFLGNFTFFPSLVFLYIPGFIKVILFFALYVLMRLCLTFCISVSLAIWSHAPLSLSLCDRTLLCLLLSDPHASLSPFLIGFSSASQSVFLSDSYVSIWFCIYWSLSDLVFVRFYYSLMLLVSVFMFPVGPYVFFFYSSVWFSPSVSLSLGIPVC